MSSAPPQPKQLSRSKAWALAAMNQLAFPGAGTVMAGRKIGYVQAVIMVVGFVLTMTYLLMVIGTMFALLTNIQISEAEYDARRHQYAWAGLSGFVLCAVAWFWSLASSISIVTSAQKEPPVLR
jgi:hypothetical protein